MRPLTPPPRIPVVWFAVLLLTGARLPAAPVSPGTPSPDSFLRTLSQTRNFTLGQPRQVQVTADGTAVLFLRAGPRDPRQSLQVFEVARGTARELLTADQLLGGAAEKLSPGEQARRERQRVTGAGLVSYAQAPDGVHLLVPLSGRLFWFHRLSGAIRELPVTPPVTDPRLSPDGRLVAYVRDHDLYVCAIDGRKERRLTTGGSARLTHGEAEFVAQEEMDRPEGYWWAPDSRHLLFEEARADGVETWQVGDPFQPGAEPVPQFYPRPGRSNVVVRLGTVPASGGRPRWISWDSARHPYLARVDWHAAGGLTLTVQSRDQRELALLAVDPRLLRTRVLLTERDDAWVNLNPAFPKWLADGSGFLWASERDGAWQVDRRRPDGALDRVLVPATSGWQGLVEVNESVGELRFRASADPTREDVWAAPLRGGPARRLTAGEGIHGITFGATNGLHVLTTATASRAARWEVRTREGRVLGALPSAAEAPPFIPQVEFARVGDGEGWHVRITRPRTFEPGRKYPVIVDVYGGPHLQVVRQSMDKLFVTQWLADQGFLVVAADGRGTPGRGRAWERALAGRLGPVPLAEQAAAVRAMAARWPELDLDRVGITGWSFGGYLSAYAVLREPGLFRAAVAGAPVTDWEDYDTHYTERYLGVPPAAADAYRESSCLTHAAGLRRPLLLIHGTRDDNVFFRHSLRLVDALVRAGKPVEVLPLPGFTHLVPDPVVAEQRWLRTVEFFHRHLGSRGP